MNQTDAILRYLEQGNSITPLEALSLFGCMRLGARCFDLKQRGIPIRSETVKDRNGKHYAKYWIEKDDKQSNIVEEETGQLIFNN